MREFLHVDDLALSIRFIIENKIEDTLINIGSGEEVSIFQLAEKNKKIVEFKGELVFDDTKPDGNPRKLLDSTLIKSHGWMPTIELGEGLNSTYQWYLENK